MHVIIHCDLYLKVYALIMQDILLADPSLKRSSEDVVLLDSCASIKSPLVSSLSYHMRCLWNFLRFDYSSTMYDFLYRYFLPKLYAK